jgi:LCP family protein required for cell wall assembly
LSEKSKKQLKLDRAVARHGNIHAAGRSRAILGILGKALVVVIVSTLTVATVSAIQITQELSRGQIDVPDLDGRDRVIPPLDGPLNILLVGSDTRSGAGNAAFGDTGGNLADVIILLHVSADRKNAVALSFPRDLMVSVPECPDPEGGDKFPARDMVQINATMNTGGPACTLLTVQQLTGVKIPYLAMIDFKGVIAMSEAVGGVTVCVAGPIKDEYTQLYLEAGEHTLIGEQALAFLRTRHGVGDGSDLSRISNQQVFLTSLVRKLKDEGALTNPFTMLRLGTAALENMTLSNSLTEIGVILGMAREVNDVDLDKITFLKLPVYSLSGANAGRVGVIKDQAQLLFDRIANDKPVVIKKANTGFGASVKETDTPQIESSTESASGEEVLPEWARGTNAATELCSD